MANLHIRRFVLGSRCSGWSEASVLASWPNADNLVILCRKGKAEEESIFYLRESKKKSMPFLLRLLVNGLPIPVRFKPFINRSRKCNKNSAISEMPTF